MSQFFTSTNSGNLPPSVATSYVTDSGTAIPSGNILNIVTNDSNINNDNGIQSIGSGNTVTVRLTNRITGSITTTDATPTTLLSVPLGSTPGVYIVQGDITAYNTTDLEGASYTYVGAATTNGVTAVEIAIENKDLFEQISMVASDFTIAVSGNSAFIEVVGLVGKTINWSALFTYRFVG